MVSGLGEGHYSHNRTPWSSSKISGHVHGFYAIITANVMICLEKARREKHSTESVHMDVCKKSVMFFYNVRQFFLYDKSDVFAELRQKRLTLRS